MNKVAICSLLIAMCAGGADAAVRVSNQNRNYASAYSQLATPVVQPIVTQEIIPVESTVAANVPLTDLERCARIYPGGEFEWAVPTIGAQRGGDATCVADVEMRFVYGTDDVIVARAKLAAGDSIECNIGAFPEGAYLPAAYDAVFPADAEPTTDDVIRVMNNEQKKNAGLKIAAGTVIGAVAGNLLSDRSVTTNKKGAGGTVIGALSGAAIMTGSSYAGKVGGDMILSGGVNAAAGGMIGNMVASGEDRLQIEDCTDLTGAKTTCLWGVIEKGAALDGDAYYNPDSRATILCNKDSVCNTTRLIAVKVKGADGKVVPLETAQSQQTFFQNITDRFGYDEQTRKISDEGVDWVRIESAAMPGARTLAMVTGVPDRGFGLKMDDWYRMRKPSMNLIGRTADGGAYALDKTGGQGWDIMDFYPVTVSASDGGIIDLDNKARLGGTLAGAGVGAGLGTFTAYQGAKGEIDERWIAAVTEYKDSLQKVYCATGTRFLTQYNDIAVIPNME